MKKRSYKLSLPRWALAQRESWYAELAARGLRVQKAGAMLTRFAPAPPARLRYRFEVGSDEGGLPAGQKEFYEECGWQYVLNDRPLHLFCAPEQTDAPDLHTDPAALADSLKTLRGSILSQALGTALWALLMFAQLTYLGRYTLELVLADAAAPLVWAILAVTLFRLGWGVYSMLALMRTRRMLRAGAMPRHGPGWRRAALAHRAACALLGAVYAVCLAVGLLELARCENAAAGDRRGPAAADAGRGGGGGLPARGRGCAQCAGRRQPAGADLDARRAAGPLRLGGGLCRRYAGHRVPGTALLPSFRRGRCEGLRPGAGAQAVAAGAGGIHGAEGNAGHAGAGKL